MGIRKQAANLLTACRLLGSLGLLAFPAFSSGFWALYLFCGLTDMADGPVARRTGSASAFGARLDTAADAVFLAAAFGKLLPVLAVPGWLWAWLALIAAIKIGNLLWGFRHGKGLVTAHTAWNRLTGLVLFLLPLTLPWVELRYSAVPVCLLATAVAVREGKVLRREGCVGDNRKERTERDKLCAIIRGGQGWHPGDVPDGHGDRAGTL